MPVYKRNVSSISKSGDSLLKGDITLSEGANITLTQSGQNIAIAGSAGGSVATDAIWDAKGDLAVGTGANTSEKLTVGANNKIVIAASGETTGLKYDYVGSLINAPQGFLINGKIVPSVASNNLTVALKGMDGNDPSATNPIYCRIGDTVRTITTALSLTANAGTNTFNSGSSELATKEVDYFVYLAWNVSGGNVMIAMSRIPYATTMADFFWPATGYDASFVLGGNTAGVATTDPYENIGRFAATQSAGAGYTWSVPTFTTTNLIQRPIYESRFLVYTPTSSGFSSVPATPNFRYKINMETVSLIMRQDADGTSNANTYTESIPFVSGDYPSVNFRFVAPCQGRDNSTNTSTPVLAKITENSSVVTLCKDFAETVWTTSGGKRVSGGVISYSIKNIT